MHIPKLFVLIPCQFVDFFIFFLVTLLFAYDILGTVGLSLFDRERED